MKKVLSLILSLLLLFSCLSVMASAAEENAVYVNGKKMTSSIQRFDQCDTTNPISYVNLSVDNTQKTVKILLCNTVLGMKDGAVSNDANYKADNFISPLYINYPGYAVSIVAINQNQIYSGASMDKGCTALYCNADSLTFTDDSDTANSLQIICNNAVKATNGIYCTGKCDISPVKRSLTIDVNVYTSIYETAVGVYSKGDLTVTDKGILKTKISGTAGKYSAAVYSEGNINVTKAARLWAIGYYKETTTKCYGIYQKAGNACRMNFAGEVIAKGNTKAVFCDTKSGTKQAVFTQIVEAYKAEGVAYYCPYPNSGWQRDAWKSADNGDMTKMTKLLESYSLFLFPGKVYMEVAGYYVHDQSAADVLGDGTVSYVPATSTLSMNNAVITAGKDTNMLNSSIYEYKESTVNVMQSATTERNVIYVLDKELENLTITLTGENIIHSSNSIYRGIYSEKNVALNGTGTLRIQMKNTEDPNVSCNSVRFFNIAAIDCRSLSVSGSVVLDIDATTSNGAIGIHAGGLEASENALITVDLIPVQQDDSRHSLYGIAMQDTRDNIGFTAKDKAKITVNTGNVLGLNAANSNAAGIIGANWLDLKDDAVIYARAGSATYSYGVQLDNDYYTSGTWTPTRSYIRDNAKLYAYSNGGGDWSFGFYMCCSSVWTSGQRPATVNLSMVSDAKNGKYPALYCAAGNVTAEDGYSSALMLKCNSNLYVSSLTDGNGSKTAHVTYSEQSSGINATKEKYNGESLYNKMGDTTNDYNNYLNTNNKYGAKYDEATGKVTDGYRFVQIWAGGETVEVRLHLTAGDSTVWKSFYIVKGQTLGNAPTPTKDGLTFRCWGTFGYSGLNEYNTSWTISPAGGYYDLYAMWDKKVTVTLDAGEGECSKTSFSEKVSEGGVVFFKDLSLPTPTIQYGKFLYWADDAGKEVAYNAQFGADVTLHAVYERTQYVLQLDADGGTLISSLLLVNAGVKYYDALSTPTKDGYTFKGWKNSAGQFVNKDTVADKDDTLTAVWEKNHTHAVSKTISAVPATCAKAGNNTYYQCSCGKYFSDSACTKETTVAAQTIAKNTNHSWNTGVITTPATCAATGIKTYTCTVCGATKTETIAKLTTHGETEIINAASATETADGYTGDKVCKICDTVIEKGKVIPKTQPDFTLGDVDGDGNITVSDARLALRQAIKLENYAEGSAKFLSCDVDKDKKVSVSDARSILRVAIKLDDKSVWDK